jgi:hypothetical protein
MSTEYTRYFSALAKYTAGDPIDDRDFDGEFDAMATALNRKVMIKSTAPGSPINGQTWVDTTNKILKWYRDTEWVSIASVHVAAAAMATPQEGDLWYDTGTGTLSFYTGAGWSAIEPAPDNSRDGLFCSRHDKDTVAVAAGIAYVGASRVAKTAETTLGLSTAASWIGGVDLRSTGAFGYVYVNAAGDIKLHTSGPNVSDLSGNSAGINRYRDFAGTYYRCLGWFYMNTTGSGELTAGSGISNFADPGVNNGAWIAETTEDSNATANYADSSLSLSFYSSGKPLLINFKAQAVGSGNNLTFYICPRVGTTDYTDFEVALSGLGRQYSDGGSSWPRIAGQALVEVAQGEQTIKLRFKRGGSGTAYVKEKALSVVEL